jgi:hypothetical protein
LGIFLPSPSAVRPCPFHTPFLFRD